LKRFLRNLPQLLRRVVQSNAEGGYLPSRALAIYAHPDDPEYFSAGTIAAWINGGCKVGYVICTDGQMGSDSVDVDPEELGRIRRAEQQSAARVLGVETTIFLGYQDGFLEDTQELRLDIVREIRRFKPEVIIISDPQMYFGEGYINHPDHRAAASAALHAVYPLASSPLVFQELEAEGLSAHSVRKVFISTWLRPNTWVDISSTIELKIDALREHRSQLGDDDPAHEIRAAAARCARFLPMKFAESFVVISLSSPGVSSPTPDIRSELSTQ
jgi:LmbE family N-acetylglucosaminyl deacetylase